jgi:tryptophan-rich sensory protein
MQNDQQYQDFKRPFWAPPAWLFGPVWSVLYIIIAISYGYVGYWYLAHLIPGMVVVPFALNLLFNVAFTPIQFGLRNFMLASIDIVLVLVTLIWALHLIYPYALWVALINLPYLAWVLFATLLQITITVMNRGASSDNFITS